MLLDHILELNNGANRTQGKIWSVDGVAVGRLSPEIEPIARSTLGPELNADGPEHVHSLCKHLLPADPSSYEHFDLIPLDGGGRITTVPRKLVPQLGIQLTEFTLMAMSVAMVNCSCGCQTQFDQDDLPRSVG